MSPLSDHRIPRLFYKIQKNAFIYFRTYTRHRESNPQPPLSHQFQRTHPFQRNTRSAGTSCRRVKVATILMLCFTGTSPRQWASNLLCNYYISQYDILPWNARYRRHTIVLKSNFIYCCISMNH